MKTTTLCVLSMAAACLLGVVGSAPASGPDDRESQRAQSHQAYHNGNYNDAYQGFRTLALDPDNDARLVGDDLTAAIACLVGLGRVDEVDALREAVVEAHAANWRLLRTAARSYLEVDHHGFLVAGEFHRGDHRGGGNVVDASRRDRVRAMQLMHQGMAAAAIDPERGDAADFFLEFGRMFHDGSEAWRLQTLTDLDTLPDYEPGWHGYREPSRGAPVDREGNPVFYAAPKTFDAAANDGQRWRWCLAQATELDPRRRNAERLELAHFLYHQFGVQTMADFGWRFGRMESDDTKDDTSGPYALHTLAETETIARLASGIKRFELPEEFNFVNIFQDVAADATSTPGETREALERLAEIFENRRQYSRAAEYIRALIASHRQADNARAVEHWQDRLEQIVGCWGRFESVESQPAGRGATVEYRFRNGREVRFSAQEILVEKLLDDVKAYLKSRPRQLDWGKIDIGNLGFRLVTDHQTRYLGREAATWEMALAPRDHHFDSRVTVNTPLSKPGAYLVTAAMSDGNTSQIILWLGDTTIVEKPLEGKTLYFVADAITGKPIGRANVEFFGFRQRSARGDRQWIDISQFAESTDADGQVIVDQPERSHPYQWLITARTPEGRFAYIGFTQAWFGRRHDQQYKATKVYTITDRPVYRPKQTVEYKLWVRHAQYDLPEVSTFAGQRFLVEIINPKGERVQQKTLAADEYGGMADRLELAEDAALGVYRIVLKQDVRPLGGGTFRVEEYKKPELEVTVDAPAEPVMLGEKIEAIVKAKYYFGSPVTHATVKYKVTRSDHTEQWYPLGPWDWLYGPGYWWFAYDYDWYPGWRDWGCRRPVPLWSQRGQHPPEVVAQAEVPIGADGTVKIAIDTAVAKAIHPDKDHRYEITAEVVDQSRRTIVGSGSVLVARKPFTVTTWVDRGYYRVGETIQARLAARTLDGRGVAGQGVLELLRITYKNNKPIETPVQTWEFPTDQRGHAQTQIKASQAGQYRLSYRLTDAKKHTIEGGYLFTVIGEGFDGADFRFSHLELVPEKHEYKPGEKVALQINTDRADSTVLLFVRPSNGVYLPPTVLRLDGKSTTHQIEVQTKDMPNFFVEALTVADGRLHSETREIIVPPAERVLSVDIEPSAETYRPGEKAKVNVRLTDFFGEPFVGSTVIAIYDKSVEYISGGSNVPEIKEFFWKWRRHHYPQTQSNLERWFANLVPPESAEMGDLGIFGGSVADDMDATGAAPREIAAMGDIRLAVGMAKGGPSMAAMQTARSFGAPVAEMASDAAAPEPGGEDGAMVEPAVRSVFADTALWVGQLTTQANGTAQVELDMPENLTTWRIKVWGMGHGTRVGQGHVDVVTRKDLILRMQTPRFFIQTDEAVLSANVHNYLASEKNVRVALELDGAQLECLDQPTQELRIAAGGEARADWRVRVNAEGEAVIRMKALTDEESDAMELRVPCYVHGMLKTDAYSGALRPDETSGKFTITVPKDRRPEQSRLEVRWSPTLAGAMVDALPYLVEYPYGCTEQTLSRFLPTVMTQKILVDMKLDLDAIRQKRTNLNAQEIGDAQRRAEDWKQDKRNPVFDRAEVRRMVKEGVKRLTEMQVSDGGWGWFSGRGERSYPHTTAYVVHGLQLAQANDVALVPDTLERGIAWLARYQDEQVQRLQNALDDPEHKTKRPWKSSADNLDAFVYMVLSDADVANQPMREFLYRDRTKLGVYAMAMFGLAMEQQGDRETLDMILQNLGQYVVEDDENQTAWLRLPEGSRWWCWYDNEIEANAYYLKLLARTDPRGTLASRLVKYLLNNRKNATYWDSTRDTALCIEAMAEFLRASGEDRPEMTVEIWLDGKLHKAVEITPDNLFSFDGALVVEGDALAAGGHEVEIKKTGRGPLYYNAYQTNFTLEEFITRSGLEIKVNRKYYRLTPVDAAVDVAGAHGQPVAQKVEKYRREELPNLATLASGEVVEIELEIDSKNDYEYLVFEDMKPAGFEPVDLRSGYTGNALGAYMEFRDNRVVMFVRRLARGRHSIAYRMRAETPGRYSALPTAAGAMYAPELKANSDEIKLHVEDQ